MLNEMNIFLLNMANTNLHFKHILTYKIAATLRDPQPSFRGTSNSASPTFLIHNLELQIPFRHKQTELALFLILNFAGSAIRNSWLVCQLLPLVLFKCSYISRLYGNFDISMYFEFHFLPIFIGRNFVKSFYSNFLFLGPVDLKLHTVCQKGVKNKTKCLGMSPMFFESKYGILRHLKKEEKKYSVFKNSIF